MNATQTYKSLSILLGISLFLINIIQSQGCCSGGTPLSGSLDLSNISKNQLSIQLTYDYNNLGDVFFYSKEINDDTRRRTTNTFILQATYALHKKISLGFLLPWVAQVEKIESITQSKNTGKGVGDLTLFAQYDLLQNKTINIRYGLGLKMPTGSTSEHSEVTGFPLSPDLQPGSGAWDMINILRVDWYSFLNTKFNINSRINYRFNGKGNGFTNQDYRFGNEFQYYLGVNRGFDLGLFLFTAQLTAKYRNTTKDKTNGFETPNTSGNWIHILPGFSLSPSPKLNIGLFTELPVYRNLEGIQLTTSFKINCSVQYIFSLKQDITPRKIEL